MHGETVKLIVHHILHKFRMPAVFPFSGGKVRSGPIRDSYSQSVI